MKLRVIPYVHNTVFGGGYVQTAAAAARIDPRIVQLGNLGATRGGRITAGSEIVAPEFVSCVHGYFFFSQICVINLSQERRRCTDRALE